MALLPDDHNANKAMHDDLMDDDNFYDDDDGDEDIIEQYPQTSTARAPRYYPGINVCIICQEKPPYSKGGKSYSTCGLTCARVLEQLKKTAPSPLPQPQRSLSRRAPDGYNNALGRRDGNYRILGPPPRAAFTAGPPPRGGVVYIMADGQTRLGREQVFYYPQAVQIPKPRIPRKPALQCVVCSVKYCHDDRYATCGIACAEKLCKTGPAKPNMCNYCHRRPKVAGHDQCGATCAKLAKSACLMCKSRPKFKRFHLCGRICKTIATKTTPLLLEAPAGHVTYEFVKKKFEASWRLPGTPVPTIKSVFKIIEGSNFLQPYDRYKKSVGNEVFRYHGTGRKCTLGSGGNTQLCANTACALCSILKTSFKTSLANPNGCFGAGVYSSSASNLSYGFTAGGVGAVMLTKVVLGNVQLATAYYGVTACPPGFNSVEYDQNGASNETIVYSDDAIRPVFLITF